MDRDKVINYLESEIKRAEQSVNDTWLECVEVKLLRDVLTLLKEQEAVPIKVDEYGNKRCGSCGYKLHWADPDFYCSKCVKAVKWND